MQLSIDSLVHCEVLQTTWYKPVVVDEVDWLQQPRFLFESLYFHRKSFADIWRKIVHQGAAHSDVQHPEMHLPDQGLAYLYLQYIQY